MPRSNAPNDLPKRIGSKLQKQLSKDLNAQVDRGARRTPTALDDTLAEFTDAEAKHVLSKLSASQTNLYELVQFARSIDPEGFQKVVDDTYEKAEDGQNQWAIFTIQELADRYGTDLRTGLTDETVLLSREIYGSNELEEPERDSWLRIFVRNMCAPVILILLAAAVVCLGFQEWPEAGVILLVVFANGTMSTYMEKSAGNALAALASLASPRCYVLRGGLEIQIDSKDVVPGDLLILSTGDAIAADLRIIETADLHTNEAILTGESEDVKKRKTASNPSSPFADNLCFSSTTVVSGKGRGLVYATGMQTQVT